MNGARAEPWVKTIRVPRKSSTTTMGSSQYFFLTRKNSQNSAMMDILLK